MVMHGHPSTLPATLEIMCLHTAAVHRGAPDKPIVADMPFLSCRKGAAFALDAAHALLNAGAHAVKLEGVEGHQDVVRSLTQSGIPVMGHLGLQPQSIHQYGGYKVQGRDQDAAARIARDASLLEQLGAFAIVLECIPATLAASISQSLAIPTIGIGAGPECDGQILVLHDLLGLNTDFQPKFVRRFADAATLVQDALASYDAAVKNSSFPSPGELLMIQVWTSLDAWQQRRAALHGSIGVVPTMGALHRGHAALIERCRRENDTAVVTLFVNPTQFNDPADLDRYPRTYTQDLDLMRALGVDDVLVPSAAEMYPHGYRYRIVPAQPQPVMEAAHRPGFLEGVMTVVLKLLNLVRAHRAYFGEKDFQQLRTVQEMAREFFLPTEIVPCPTVRAASGLAESSRNRLLSPHAVEQAAALYHILATAPSAAQAVDRLSATGLAPEYVEEHWGRRFAAVYLEGVRLIDNVPLPNQHHAPRS